MRRVAVVPGVLALRPEYASLVDPVPDLREAVAAVRAWAGEEARVITLNGSARRTQASPGPFDERAVPFDTAMAAALLAADAAALRAVDASLAGELWASVEELPALADLLEGASWRVGVDYDDAPYGVAWWVLRYEEVVE
jgi:hypothetical protein